MKQNDILDIQMSTQTSAYRQILEIAQLAEDCFLLLHLNAVPGVPM